MSAPRVSVVMPVRDVAPYVREAIESVLRQTFTDFELIVIDDGSVDDTAAIAGSLGDPRVRVERIARAGLAGAENAGFALARGEYVARMDGDDLVEPALLAEQIAVLDACPSCAGVGVWTRRFGARRTLERPPADPRAIRRGLRRSWVLSQPMLYRADAVRAVGGFRDELSEDWDLWIRLAARFELRVVPSYLALVRTRAGSYSRSASALGSRADKMRMRLRAATSLGVDPVSLALLASGALGLVVARARGSRAEPPVGPEPPPRDVTVSVVIPTCGRPALLARCLAALSAQVPRADEVIVVQSRPDAATDSLLREWTARDPVRHRAVRAPRPGIVPALATGTAAARFEVVAYLDDDAAPRPGWLAELRRAFLDPRVGAAGGRVLDHVDGVLRTGRRARRIGAITTCGRFIGHHDRDADRDAEVDWLTGANMAIRRHVAVHDERLRHTAGGIALANDVDVCLTVRRAGYRVLYTPWAVVDHHTTSYRDPVLGSRVAGEDVQTSAANNAYVARKHLRGLRLIAMHAYGYLVGTSSIPGPARALAEFARSPARARAMAGRIPHVWRGRREGARMARGWADA